MPKQQRNRSGKSKNSSPFNARLHALELQMAQRIVNPKYIQGNITSASLVNGTPSSSCLNAVIQGTDETQRIGDICKMEWLEMGISFTSQATFVLGAFNVRVMVISETSSLGAAASFPQVFTTATPAPITQRNYVTRDDKRFHVWYDSGSLPLGPTGFTAPAVNTNTYGYPPVIEFNLPRINLNHLRTDYSRGNSGTVTDIDTNALSLMVFTDNTNANYISFAVPYVIKFLD